MRIGVDVGGTNTDAVVINGEALLSAVKKPTTDDISSGVLDAVRTVLADAAVDPAAIEAVMLGTTQFTNAVVRRRDLAPVGALRIGAQSASALPIAAKWPTDLKSVVLAAGAQVDGGAEYDGSPIKPLDEAAARAALEEFGNCGVDAVAITSVFAPVDAAHERKVAAMAREILPDALIACSSSIGGLGLYQRENATLLNAALLPFAARVAPALSDAFAALSLQCPFFISQNDGTLMAADFARAFPVLTFSSGPTNSMRGAAFLTGERDAMVIDIGGTTSDIGMLIEGYPRPSGVAVKVGGVLTNFRMPDVLAIGLGGGSLVSDGGRRIGPESAGAAITRRALSFGGAETTMSDVAAAAGRIVLAGATAIPDIETGFCATALDSARTMLADGVDRMKTSADDLPLIAVGGGAFLVPDDLPGVSRMIRPDNAGVANAIGAAFSQIGAEGEAIYVRGERTREDAAREAQAQALARAVDAGATPERTEIVHLDETPMAYLEQGGGVVKARAIGAVDLGRLRRIKGETR